MGLLKKAAKAEQTEPVTREEFNALAAQLESFKAVAALAVAAVDLAAKDGIGLPGSTPRERFEALAGAADLEPAERGELQAFLKRLDTATRIERQREFRELQKGTEPRKFRQTWPG